MVVYRIPLVLVLTFAGVSACRPGQPGSDDEAGGDSSKGESETSDGDATDAGDQACVPNYEAECADPIQDQRDACLAACNDPRLSCVDEACWFDCWYQYFNASWTCVAPRCPHPPWPDNYLYSCYADALTCAQANDCSPRTCSFDAMVCVAESGYACEAIEIDFPYAGSCELALPGPTPGYKVPYVSIESMAMGWSLGMADDTCGDPPYYVDARWADDNYDRIILCDDTCETFALEGSIRVGFGGPACDG